MIELREITKRFGAVLANDRVSIKVLNQYGASPVASLEAPAFRALADAARRVFGDIVVAPGLTLGITDSKYYATVSDNSYRFNPMIVVPKDLTGFHGTDERVSVENLVRATRFYIEIMKTAP